MSAQRAPYASTGSIKAVIEKHRQVGLQEISLERLQRIGITEALAPRTLQSLVFFGFYDENGRVTPEFDALRKLPEPDFKPALSDLLTRAYAQVFEVLDPATATITDIENAFRGFEPTGQLPRMVQLFIGLMAYVGLMPEAKRRGGVSAGQSDSRASRSKSSGDRRPPRERKDAPEPPPEPERENKTGHQDFNQSAPLDAQLGERRDVSLGDAGSVSVIVNVRWLDLPEEQFTKLRKLIKDIEALGTSGIDSRESEEST